MEEKPKITKDMTIGELLDKYPTTAQIARMHLDTLVGILRIKGNRVEAAENIKALAKQTIGQLAATDKLLLTSALDDIKHFEAQT